MSSDPIPTRLFLCRDPATGAEFYGQTLSQALDALIEFAHPALYRVLLFTVGDGETRVDRDGVTFLSATMRS